MSVINNVLKSLESRESQFTPIEIPSIEQGNGARRKHNPLLIGGLLLLTLLVAGGYYWQNQSDFGLEKLPLMSDEVAQAQATIAVAPLVRADPPAVVEIAADQQITEQPQLNVPVVVPAAVPAAVPVTESGVLPGNQIVGLQIRESETEMRLEFILRERAATYLKERGENNFSYHLRDIESRIVAPLIRDNRWIRKLTILPSDGGVDVDFATTPDILVETRLSERDGESVWVIFLREAKPVVPVIVANLPTNQEPSQSVAVETKSVVDVAPALAEPEAPVKLDIKSANPVTQTTNQLDYAVQLMNSGRTEEAESLLRSLLGGTHDYSARKHLLALYNRLDRPARLRSLLQSSLAEYPLDSFFMTEYARTLFAATAYREVITLLGSVQGLDADQQALLAASYQRLDQHKMAVRHYQLALQQDAENARNWVGLGISHEQNAAFGAALDAYQEANRLGGLNARLQAFVVRRGEQLSKVVN